MQSVDTATPDPCNEIRYILDMTLPYDNLLMTQGAQNQSFVWGNDLIAATGGEKFYYLQDHLSSPIRLLGGEQNDTPLAYDEFGVPVVGVQQTQNNPFGFTGYQTDDVTGLYYAQARYYSPRLGRFWAEDPHWSPGNIIFGDERIESEYALMPDMMSIIQSNNLYIYCLSNPLRFVDATAYNAGDTFNTPNAAAIDFAKNYYAITEYTKMELAAKIYTIEKNNKTYYTYTEPVMGEIHSTGNAYIKGENKEIGNNYYARIHTHPFGTKFSDADLKNAKKRGEPSYVVTPDKKVLKYVQNKITREWQVLTAPEILKIKLLTSKEMKYLTEQYLQIWEDHLKIMMIVVLKIKKKREIFRYLISNNLF